MDSRSQHLHSLKAKSAAEALLKSQFKLVGNLHEMKYRIPCRNEIPYLLNVKLFVLTLKELICDFGRTDFTRILKTVQAIQNYSPVLLLSHVLLM